MPTGESDFIAASVTKGSRILNDRKSHDALAQRRRIAPSAAHRLLGSGLHDPSFYHGFRACKASYDYS